MRIFWPVFLILFALVALIPIETCAQGGLISDPDSLLATLGVTEPGSDENLIDVILVPDLSTAGVASTYQIDFKVEQFTYDLLKNGGLKFAFPDGFDLTLIESIDISDYYEPLELEVERYEISEQLLTVHLQQAHMDEEIDVDETLYIDVSLYISSIGNPLTVGDYQVAAVAFKQSNAIIAGPTFSEPFTIEPNFLQTILAYPSGDMTLQAGDEVTFSAEGFDGFGNKIDGLVFSWSLDCDNCIGVLTDSTITATTPGQAHVLAASGDVTGSSGLITVEPGDLGRMDLVLSDTQFVGHALRGDGTITLYDGSDNLKTDYVLSAQPISLVPSIGLLTPDILTDDGLVSNGVVQLLPAGITYDGLSGTINVQTESGNVISNYVPVSFNGYDILDVLDLNGETISSVYSDGWTVTNLANIVIHREGNLAPVGQVTATARFLSNPEGAGHGVPSENLSEGTDTISLFIPSVEHPDDEDTLLVTLTAYFEYEGETYATVDTALYPVDVLPLNGFSFVEGSFQPDTAIEDVPFDISFHVFSEGFALPVDSTVVKVRLWDAVGGNHLADLYDGNPVPLVGFNNGTLRFENLQAILPQSIVMAGTYYQVDVILWVYTSSTLLGMEDRWVDSLYVVRRPDISVDPSTLIPTTVSAGSIASFRFTLEAETEVPLDFISDGSSFTVSGAGFSTSTSLNLPGNRIEPGENVFTTEGVFIPESQLGSSLSVATEIQYSIPGVSGEQVFSTDFDQTTIAVTALPAIKIIDVEAIAPNSPKVNTGQTFQISAVVANVSPTPVSALGVLISSDGSSSFDSSPLLVNLGAFDTTEVFWEITAASQPNPAEIFVVSIDHTGVTELPAEDNVALVTIESPAELDLTYSVFGAENGLIDYGNDLTLTVELVNYGIAEVASTEYILVTEGFDTDGPDTLIGGISVDKHIDFSFVAPQRDTTLTLTFSLLSLPIDLNTGERALAGDTSFLVTVTVISAEASLYIEAVQIGTNLVLPGREKEIFQLDLTNTGISSATTFQVEEITLLVKSTLGTPLEAMSVFSIGNTGFYEGEQKISTLVAGDSALVFSFDQFIIEPQEERSVVLRAEFRETDISGVVLEMARDGLVAKFIYPPNEGMSPEITSNVEEGESLLQEALTISSASFDASFMIQNNPYNPEDPDPDRAMARFAYVLLEDTDIEFRIFTLTGEEVYSIDYTAGSDGGSGNPDEPNVVEWDGRNSSGRVVMNGVYIALIKNINTGETATIKVAVVK